MSTTIASNAAGIAPARTRLFWLRASPVTMGSPNPPAPMKAASVGTRLRSSILRLIRGQAAAPGAGRARRGPEGREGRWDRPRVERGPQEASQDGRWLWCSMAVAKRAALEAVGGR